MPWIALGLAVAIVFGYLDWSRTQWIQRATEANIAAQVNAKTIDYLNDTAEMSKAFNAALAEKEATHARQLGKKISEINQLRLTADKMAKLDPMGFGDDYHVRLARVMCRIQAGTNRDDRATCNNAPDEAYLSDIAFTITVTAETAEVWSELCDDGQRDFCDWSLTGRTPQGALTELSWLEAVDAYALRQGDQIDGFHGLIEKITQSEPK